MRQSYIERNRRLWADPKMRKRLLAGLARARAVLAQRQGKRVTESTKKGR